MKFHPDAALVAFLFTDIEGSALLWERDPERMRKALALHDRIVRSAIEEQGGIVVKMVGDGAYAAFSDPLGAILAAAQMQRRLSHASATEGVTIPIRCGIHVGACERRDDDYFGPAVNRAARIMGLAHGGQILVSQAAVSLVRDRMPPDSELRDLGEVHLRGLATPERLYQLSSPGLRDDFAPPHRITEANNNLPLQLTSFVGRQREMADVRTLLGKTRLLTLLGPGGIGKTRLALQVAAGCVDQFSDGIWLVELASVSDTRLLAQSVASILGVREQAGRPVLESVKAYVEGRQALLILDNCEHMTRSCADLAAQLLAAGSGLTILASSREPLQLAGETTYAVPPLAKPEVGTGSTPQGLLQYDAARLFIERARAIRPDFEVSDKAAPAVSSICRQLDGIPLAIELAAVHVRVLEIDEIAKRLSDRLRLLSRGFPTALPRHRTIRASIDWSYELLLPQERWLLRRLAVFAGGWTLEAAEVVGDGTADGAASANVFELLSNLVDKSLVARDAHVNRYRLLDTVRQYAHEKLVASGDEPDARLQHLSCFVSLTRELNDDTVGLGDRFLKLDLERENLFVAFESCALLDGPAGPGMQLALSIKQWVISRGLLALGYRLTVEAARRSRHADPLTCQVLCAAGQLAFLMGHYELARNHIEEGLAAASGIGSTTSVAEALRLLGYVHLAHDEADAARERFESALALSRQLGDEGQVAAALNGLGEWHRFKMWFDSALPLYREAVALDRHTGDRRRLAIHLCNLAGVLVALGQEHPGVDVLLEALAIGEEISSKQVGRNVLEYCACLAAILRCWPDAARFYGATERHSAEMGYHREPMDVAFLPPLMLRTRSELDVEAFDVAENDGRSWTYREAVAAVRAWLTARRPRGPSLPERPLQ